jgi:outer membrane protein
MSVFSWRVVSIGFLLSTLAAGSVQATDLLELFTRSLEFDPAYQSARYRRDLAREVMREARSGRLPSITANAESSKTWQSIKSSDNILFQEGSTDFLSQTYSISLTQPVYNPDAQARVPQARAVDRRAAAEFAAAEQDLIYRLAEAHFNVLAARDGLQFANAERVAIEKQLDESEQRLASGLGRVTAVHEARARFSLARAAELDARDRLEQSRRAIAEITGALPQELTALSESFPLVEPDQTDVEVWVQAAMFQNPSIQALLEAVEVENHEIRRVRGTGRMPRLDLVTAYNARDSGGTVFGGGNDIGTTDVTLRLSIPLYDGGRTHAATRTAVLQKQIRTQELEIEKRRVEKQTRDAFEVILSSITRVDALGQSVFSQEAALAAKQEELGAGLATRLEVLDITKDLFSARRDLAEARYVYILNSLRLKQAAGILSVDDLRQINAYLQ